MWNRKGIQSWLSYLNFIQFTLFTPYVSILTDDQFFVILSIGHNEALCSVAVLCDLDKLSLLFQFTKVLHYLKKPPKKQTKNQNFQTTSKDYFQPLLTTFLPYHKFHCIFSENKALEDDTSWCHEWWNEKVFFLFLFHLFNCLHFNKIGSHFIG